MCSPLALLQLVQLTVYVSGTHARLILVPVIFPCVRLFAEVFSHYRVIAAYPRATTDPNLAMS